MMNTTPKEKTMTTAYLITQGTGQRNENYHSVDAVAAAWLAIKASGLTATIRFILDDGTVTTGTYDMVKPIFDAMQAVR